jgi:hypothetical protein
MVNITDMEICVTGKMLMDGINLLFRLADGMEYIL